MTLPARELMREPFGKPRVEAHQRERLRDALAALLRRSRTGDRKRLCHRHSETKPRVEGPLRLLQHHRHASRKQKLPGSTRGGNDIAKEAHRPLRGRLQAQQ
ncbi:hypothetical protein D9M68_849060 [compost metagenome]